MSDLEIRFDSVITKLDQERKVAQQKANIDVRQISTGSYVC